MIAAQRILTTDERRVLDRDHALGDVLSITTSGLPPRGEQAIRVATMRHFEPILDLADSATVALLELEAIDRRLDAHARTHLGCTFQQPCWRYRTLKVRRGRLQAAHDRAYRALLCGRR